MTLVLDYKDREDGGFDMNIQLMTDRADGQVSVKTVLENGMYVRFQKAIGELIVIASEGKLP